MSISEENHVDICKALGIQMDISGEEILAQVRADKRSYAELVAHATDLQQRLDLVGAVNPNYESLAKVLMRALDQASAGKGKERHSYGEPFEEQKICQINRWLGSPDGDLYQAIKKIVESKRLPHARAVSELLGAINYVAAGIIIMEEQAEKAASVSVPGVASTAAGAA